MEFGLLAFLAENRGRAFSRKTILEKVRGYERGISTRSINFHILSLRRKIEDDPSHPVHLVTVRGFGYKFEE
jgi:DNA-binding response OmpR family regulator